jgi:folate-binding protein YgfZ
MKMPINPLTPDYQALTDSAAIIDLSRRGRIRVTGEDRARLLHAMTTNHVQNLQPGQGQYTFFLNAQGQIQADAYILCFAGHFLLDVEPQTRHSVYQHLDHFIIADDVTLEDVTDETFAFGLEGPQALQFAAQAGMAVPNAAFAHTEYDPYSIAAISYTGEHGIRIYGPALRKDDALETLTNAGAILATAEDAEASRIVHFKPRYGRDITEKSLPQETQQTRAVHFQKGCYLGQEIVERVRSRGHINRLLMGFTGESEHAPAVGAKVAYGGKEDGEVTSAVAIDGAFYGLAIVRAQIAQPGTVVGIDGRPATLVTPAV